MHHTYKALFSLCLLAFGCGGDPAEATSPDGGAELVSECLGTADGTPCDGGERLCQSDLCLPSTCGDGFVDAVAGEQCEDGNATAGDGCEPDTCQFSCDSDTQCDDGDPCNGTETCNQVAHRCQAATPVDGAECALSAMDSGLCRGGLCGPPGCGNGLVDGDEQCDDANLENGDGCDSNCTFSCESDADCGDENVCNGQESCNTETHTCGAGEPLDCDDGEACTEDSCDPVDGCQAEQIDADGDGVSPMTCTALPGDDCDDRNPVRYPGAPEHCDGIDNDCDPEVDEAVATIQCYPDLDGDTFPADVEALSDCSCPLNYRPARADGRTDCRDMGLPEVNPDQTSYFDEGYCLDGSDDCAERAFDYDCDGEETKLFPAAGGCGFDCTNGWSGGVPACGDSGTYVECRRLLLGCETVRSVTRIQTCR